MAGNSVSSWDQPHCSGSVRLFPAVLLGLSVTWIFVFDKKGLGEDSAVRLQKLRRVLSSTSSPTASCCQVMTRLGIWKESLPRMEVVLPVSTTAQQLMGTFTQQASDMGLAVHFSPFPHPLLPPLSKRNSCQLSWCRSKEVKFPPPGSKRAAESCWVPPCHTMGDRSQMKLLAGAKQQVPCSCTHFASLCHLCRVLHPLSLVGSGESCHSAGFS